MNFVAISWNLKKSKRGSNYFLISLLKASDANIYIQLKKGKSRRREKHHSNAAARKKRLYTSD